MVKTYVPLDVQTFKDGTCRLAGLMAWCALCFLSAAIMTNFELRYFNIEDTDWRDLLLDYRVTNSGKEAQHDYFRKLLPVDGTQPDVTAGTLDDLVSGYSRQVPVVNLRCTDLLACSSQWEMLLSAAGRSPFDCENYAPVMLVSSQESMATEPTIVTHRDGAPQAGALNATSVTTAEVAAWLAGQVSLHRDAWFRPPTPWRSVRTDAVTVGGQAVRTRRVNRWNPKNRKKFGWPRELWTWLSRCPNTTYDQIFFTGNAGVSLPPYKPYQGFQVVPLSIYNKDAVVPAYSTAPDGLVSPLSKVELQIGMSTLAAPCSAWDLIAAKPVYGPATLSSAFEAGTAALLNITVRDVSEPFELRLPSYSGQAYIYGSIIVGGIGFFPAVTIPLWLLIAHWTSRINRGLPPPFFRYFRRYRGWGTV